LLIHLLTSMANY